MQKKLFKNKRGFTPLNAAVLPSRRRGYSMGFSIIEMVVVVGLVAIITTILSSFLVQSMKNYRLTKGIAEQDEKAAQVLRDFEQESRAATKILVADSNELKFLRFFDLESPSPTQVRYFVDGNQFKIGLTEPAGTEPNVTYPAQNEVIDLIVDDVINTGNLFKYYDGSEGILVEPINLPSIRMVELDISLDRNGSMPPAATTETTKITLRNMKDNL